MKKLESGTRLVIGKNSVREVVLWVPNRIVTFLASKEPKLILNLELPAQYKWQKLDFDTLTELAHSDSHQGIAVIVKEPAKLELKQTIKELVLKEKIRIVVLSSVQDPHHLGAIFRAAESFGCDLIIWSKQHSPGITAAVSKVAVGATELVPYCEVVNINDALRKLKEAGVWLVAAEPGENHQSLSQFEFPNQVAIILGAEGEGIPRLTLELSDFQVAIEQHGKIDSLSLSQAAAVFLYAAQVK